MKQTAQLFSKERQDKCGVRAAAVVPLRLFIVENTIPKISVSLLIFVNLLAFYKCFL